MSERRRLKSPYREFIDATILDMWEMGLLRGIDSEKHRDAFHLFARRLLQIQADEHWKRLKRKRTPPARKVKEA